MLKNSRIPLGMTLTKQTLPLTAYTEEQRMQAQARFAIIRPFLEEGVPLTQIAQAQHLPLRTARRWVAEYRRHGLAGLIRQMRSDQGKRRGLPTDLPSLIEGLALQKPKRSIAAIHRRAAQIAEEQGWPHPSYDQVYAIVKALDPRLLTLAHEGSAAYREEGPEEADERLQEMRKRRAMQQLKDLGYDVSLQPAQSA